MEKTWAQKTDTELELESDADEQLILHVPYAVVHCVSASFKPPIAPFLALIDLLHSFTGQVRLHSLHVLTSPSPSAPRTLHLHLNTDDLDFTSAASARPTQTITLSQTSEVQDILVKRQLFNSCRSLTLFFEDNYGYGDEDVSRISYLGFKGDFMKLSREPVEVMYEAAARPSDHKVKGEVGVGMGMGLGGGRQGF